MTLGPRAWPAVWGWLCGEHLTQIIFFFMTAWREGVLLLLSPFYRRETEVQRKVTCPESHSQEETEQEIRTQASLLQSPPLNHHPVPCTRPRLASCHHCRCHCEYLPNFL